MDLGKRIRLERIINRVSRKMIIVPMDHGLTIGTVEGLGDIRGTINKIADGGANAVIVHAGIAETGHRGTVKMKNNTQDIGLIIHLNGSTMLSPQTNRKAMVCSVEEALRLGADGVSIHINIGAEDEPEMLTNMGEVAMKCRYWGVPLIAMMYPRGPNIENPSDPHFVNVAARAGAELGADIIKTVYTGDVESFKKITSGCPVPIIIAGGPKMDTKRDLLQTIYDAVVLGGAQGIGMGRNIFQDSDPSLLIKTIGLIVHEDLTVKEAVKQTGLKN